MNQIVPYVPPQPSDPLMEKISRLERAVNKLSGDKYDVADLYNLSLYPKVRLPYGFKWPEIYKYNGTECITKSDKKRLTSELKFKRQDVCRNSTAHGNRQ